MPTPFESLLNKIRPLVLPTLSLSPGLRVVVLAPHPDDFDVISVTLRHLRDNRNPINLAVLTSGASGVEDCFQSKLNKAGKAALREAEQRAGCQFFGLPEERLNFLRLNEDADGHLEDSVGNLDRLRAWWMAHPADLVFLPHGNDTNAAHRRTYAMFRRICSTWPGPVAALLNRDPKTLAMREDVVMPFGATEAEWKGQLLRFHQTQQQRNLRTRGQGLDERILQVNRQAAARLGMTTDYAEAFELDLFLPERGGRQGTGPAGGQADMAAA